MSELLLPGLQGKKFEFFFSPANSPQNDPIKKSVLLLPVLYCVCLSSRVYLQKGVKLLSLTKNTHLWRVEEIVQSAGYLPYKNKDLISDSSTYIKKPAVTACCVIPALGVGGTGGSLEPRSQPANFT